MINKINWIILLTLLSCYVSADPLASANSSLGVSLGNTTCIQSLSSWSSWSSCSGGQQSRTQTCYNCSNICGNTTIDTDTRGCSASNGRNKSSSCVSKYVCVWSQQECIEGYQYKSCYDSNKCYPGNFTQSFACETEINEPEPTDAPEENIMPIYEECPVCKECSTCEEKVCPEISYMILDGGKCDILDRVFRDNSQVSEYCQSGWCNDGILKNVCSPRPEQKETNSTWFDRLRTNQSVSEMIVEEKDQPNYEFVGWLFVLIPLLTLYIYLKKRNKRRMKQFQESLIPDKQPINNLPPNLTQLFNIFKGYLDKSLDHKDYKIRKEKLIEKAKKLGWQEEDLELIFYNLENNK